MWSWLWSWTHGLLAWLVLYLSTTFLFMIPCTNRPLILFLRATGALHHSVMKIEVGNFIDLILLTLKLLLIPPLCAPSDLVDWLDPMRTFVLDPAFQSTTGSVLMSSVRSKQLSPNLYSTLPSSKNNQYPPFVRCLIPLSQKRLMSFFSFSVTNLLLSLEEKLPTLLPIITKNRSFCPS